MKLSKFKKGDVVLIKWVDSFSTGRWYNFKELDEWLKDETICESIGCFYKATKKSIILYQNIGPDEYGNVTNIPRSAIIGSKLIKRFK